jgi:hypothetical protein
MHALHILSLNASTCWLFSSSTCFALLFWLWTWEEIDHVVQLRTLEVYVGIAEWSMLIDIKKQEVQVLLSGSFIIQLLS